FAEIEQDENLRYLIIGKDYREIADDSLTYNTYKKYDSIFMQAFNANGIKQVLQEIELIEKQQRSGQIVCLLNAETLKNPYSNDRKFRIRKLEEINAEVEYIQNAFSNSERNTEVETALIYISIEKQEYDSVLIEELKKDESHKISADYK
ncbi:hypothetical protein PV939_11810, partial [Ligilactobacillus salivarius]|nr:hypothetical protein [Ligilactobacillus salivarius]